LQHSIIEEEAAISASPMMVDGNDRSGKARMNCCRAKKQSSAAPAARFADGGYSGDRRQRDPGYAPFFGALISAS
jgi:hypothetical protein